MTNVMVCGATIGRPRPMTIDEWQAVIALNQLYLERLKSLVNSLKTTSLETELNRFSVANMDHEMRRYVCSGLVEGSDQMESQDVCRMLKYLYIKGLLQRDTLNEADWEAILRIHPRAKVIQHLLVRIEGKN